MKSKLLSFLCIFLCMFFIQSVLAQGSRTVTGRVISSDDQLGLPGVSVMVKGSSVGTQTDLNGNFKINVPGTNAILVFTSIGFEVQERTVGTETSINVTMNPQGTNLNEVVVIGYGEVSRKDLTGAVSSVKMPDLQKAPVRSFEEALAGRVAGVTASADDGQPGSNVSVVIRGNNSITQDNSPLYVIDGFPVENPDNNALNPQEIESIEVLKDASSTAIYGSRGANGVIVITTKKGKEGKPVINYNGFYGFMKNTNKMEMMDPYEYVRYLSERNPGVAASRYLDSLGRTFEDYRNVESISLQDSLFGNVPFANHSISLSGGSKGTRYLISGNLLDQDGIIVNSGYNRYQGRVNIDQTVNERFKVGLNTTYSNTKQFGISPSTGGNGFYQGNLLYSVWAFRPVATSVIQIDQDEEFEDEDQEFVVAGGFNPIKTAQNTVRESFSNIFTSNIFGNYDFAKYFKLRITGGITSTRRRNISFNGSQTPFGSPLTNSGITNGVNGSILFTESTSWLNENTLTFNRKFTPKHSLNVLVGATAQGFNAKTSGSAVTHIPNEYLGISGFDEGIPLRVTATSGEYTLGSFLGRVNYTFNEKYMFTASMRADGSSKFPKGNKWGYFPSAAIAWRLSDENFM
ncbi:MAG TPA: SusC/RagA family TonB-linked outer membrane protein, partial [Sphingobacteriaceae bacterium]